ncbi:hypothetical protein ABPG74_019458 [Tetrahymena malaccensis]
MKTSILKQVLEQKIALRAEIILIFEAFSKQKPQFEIICEQIQVRNLNCQGKALQFKIFDKLSQSRKVIEVFSIDKFQDNIFNIIEYAQKSKNLVRQDLIWKVFDCYYLDEDMLFYAVEYEDYDFTCLEIQHNKEISSQFELEQYLQEIYAYSQQSLNPNIKQKITQNLCQSAYYVFQKQNNNQTSVKLCTVHPYLFQEVIGYCKYFCQIPSALKIKNNQDFNLLKQKTEKNDKKTLFQQIQHFSPSFLDQNPKIIEHIINTENDLEKYQLTSVNVEEGYFTLNGESANNLTIFQIHKFNSEEAANQKLEEFKQISQQLNEINIQVTTNFEILPNQQLTYLIIKTKQIKSNRNLYNFIQIFNELYNNLDCCLLEIPCWDESLLNNIYKLSYLLPPRPEQYLKQLEIVINLNKMVEGNLFGISPFGFENITFIIQNQGNKSLKIISKLLQENTNFDIIHFYSGFLFYENFLQLKKQIDDYIQSDYFIYFYESLDEILAQQCFKDFSTNQKTKISNLYSEYKKINNTEFDQGNLEIQFCSCVLEARINRLQGICMLSNYVMNQNILGDDTDEKFICICNMLNSITNMVIKNQKNLKIFKFQVYLCGNVKKQLEGQEDYFGLSDKLNLFLLDISYFTQQSNQIFYRKLIFNQLKKNLRNVSTLNLSEKVEKRPSKLNIFKKLKRVVCINII